MTHYTITNAGYENAVKPDTLSVIDFWAEWCGPCRMMGAELDEIPDSAVEGMRLFKANVDEEPLLADKFGISVIPTLVFIKGGKEVFRFSGYKKAEELISIFNKYR